MYTLFAILIIIVCVLLILIIMIQNPKGGGLSSAFGGGNQIMGARKTGDFLEKTTWTLAIILVSLALLSNFAIPRNQNETDSIIEEIDIPINDELDLNDFDMNELEKNSE